MKEKHQARLDANGHVMRWDERYRLLRQEFQADIELMRSNGLTFQQIGNKLGVSRAAVNNFLKGYNLRDK